MANKKSVKKEVDEVEKDEVVEISALEKKRNDLISEIKPKLLTQSQLKEGGGDIKSRYAAEQGYLAILNEINDIGKVLGLSPIGMGHLREK